MLGKEELNKMVEEDLLKKVLMKPPNILGMIFVILGVVFIILWVIFAPR